MMDLQSLAPGETGQEAKSWMTIVRLMLLVFDDEHTMSC